MRPRTVIKTTLGDLIVALTDEVMPVISDPAGVYIVVSSVLDEMLTHQPLRDNNLPRRKLMASHIRRSESCEIGEAR